MDRNITLYNQSYSTGVRTFRLQGASNGRFAFRRLDESIVGDGQVLFGCASVETNYQDDGWLTLYTGSLVYRIFIPSI